ncbi:MAG: non-canonical purine NTP pyrophosphatase [Chloroflexota bacterium]
MGSASAWARRRFGPAPPPAGRDRSRHKLRSWASRSRRPQTSSCSPDDLGIEGEPDETGKTFETNARIKARYYARRSGLPTLADDLGLEVDALNGAPSASTPAGSRAWTPPTSRTTRAKLLRELAGLPPERRGGRYVCVLALALPEEGAGGPRALPIVAGGAERAAGASPTAARRGRLRLRPDLRARAGAPGGRTLGQWSAAEKHAISHRLARPRACAPCSRSMAWRDERQRREVHVPPRPRGSAPRGRGGARAALPRPCRS